MHREDRAAIHSRLLILEALAVMAVGERYVDIAKADPAANAVAMIRRDVRLWFDRIADTPGCDPASLDFESSRMLGAIEEHVRDRLAPKPGSA